MLARRTLPGMAFTRRDAGRLVVAATILVAALTAVLSVDILPRGVSLELGQVAPADVNAPREIMFTSEIETERARAEAREAVVPQYDYTPEIGQQSSARQLAAFGEAMQAVDAAFEVYYSIPAREQLLDEALPDLSDESRETLLALTPSEWTQLRTEMQRVLESVQQQEVRDTLLPVVLGNLADRLRFAFSAQERELGQEIVSPFVMANSTYDEQLTAQARTEAANAVEPVTQTIRRGELLVQRGQQVTETDLERLELLGLLDARPDFARLAGWALLSALLVALLLGWVWRFRPAFWHRNNALLLVGLVLVGATVVLKVSGDSSILPFVVPVAAAGLLVAVLLDSSAAIVVVAVLGVLASRIAGSVELGAFVFLGGFAGVVAVRRGERLSNFLQAAVAMALVNLAVVSSFTLLGERDLTGVLQLWGASVVAAIGSAIAAVGSFALLGNIFGITTSFQLLELANPSQPLLRRLLLETSGTYHHSLMVGNLSERAAEAIGADPLIARVAAYYHDIGKLANPLAFIENQGGMENVHDELAPEQSAAVLKQHVADGIDLAYRYHVPKAIIPFIPQHHGTALM
ncbi:MAG: HDIG domain-containing protein, partial [Chloroflexi bacterium]|nr:HDIG domain-containing protein [Chloroflexota bacterium]